MRQDDTRPTVRVTTHYDIPRGDICVNLCLPEIRTGQFCPSERTEETIKAMKTTLDQKFYGDAKCALQAMRLIINNTVGQAHRQDLLCALDRIKEKLQLRANLDLTQL